MLRPTAQIELIYMDETGNTSAVVLNVPSSSSIEIMDVNATALASLIAPMTDATLIKIRNSYRAVIGGDISDAGSAPIVASGTFFFEDFAGGNIGLVTVPSFKDALIVTDGFGSGILIDTENEDVFSFIEGILASGVCTPFGDLFYRLRSAYVQRRV